AVEVNARRAPRLGFDRGADARAAEPDRIVPGLIGVDVGRIRDPREWRWRGTSDDHKSEVLRAHLKKIVARFCAWAQTSHRDVLIYVVRARRRLHGHRARPSPGLRRRPGDR